MTLEYVLTLHEAIYGEIQLCRNISTQSDVAVKVMNMELVQSRTSVAGLSVHEDALNELRIAHILSQHPHPNIVKIRDVIMGDEECRLVMNHYPGGELFHYNDTFHNFQMPSPMIHRMFCEISSGLAHLHRLQIAHRDISLENILLDDHLHCRICDFGLASQNGDQCVDAVGKLYYMAPEVLNTDELVYDGYKADMWSLGVLLFILFTGNPPFEYATTRNVHFRKFLRLGVKGLVSQWKLTVPDSAIHLMENLLVFQPSRRFTITQVLKHCYVTATPRRKLLRAITSVARVFKSSIPCGHCFKIIGLGHRKPACHMCAQLMCSKCIEDHPCYRQSVLAA